jgi:hypothetical protein
VPGVTSLSPSFNRAERARPLNFAAHLGISAAAIPDHVADRIAAARLPTNAIREAPGAALQPRSLGEFAALVLGRAASLSTLSSERASRLVSDLYHPSGTPFDSIRHIVVIRAPHGRHYHAEQHRRISVSWAGRGGLGKAESPADLPAGAPRPAESVAATCSFRNLPLASVL